jgi:hypothetical protein
MMKVTGDWSVATVDGRAVLRHPKGKMVTTPVVCSDGNFYTSQLEASKAHKLSSSCVHHSVSKNKVIKRTGVSFRYAREDEILDWLTRPSQAKPASSVAKTASAENTRSTVLVKVLKGQLADALAKIDQLESAERKASKPQTIEGFEFPGGPAVLRISSDPPCVVMRNTKAELPPELVAVCKWRT